MGAGRGLVDQYTEGTARAAIERTIQKALYGMPCTQYLGGLVDPITRTKLQFFADHGYWPSVADPTLFSEHILHRIWCTDDERFARIADKWRVREYVSERVGAQVLNEIYHVTENPATIPFGALPRRFVLKSTHGCGHVEVVEDGRRIDVDELVDQCRNWLAESFGEKHNEYWYDEITPRIIVEEYIDENGRTAPREYKFMTFGGRVESIAVLSGRFSELSVRFYDRNWEPREFTMDGLPKGPVRSKPAALEGMIDVAETLGEEFEFARIDLYSPTEGSVRFGEITLSPGAGTTVYPPSVDAEFGTYWTAAKSRSDPRGKQSDRTTRISGRAP